MKTCHEMFFIKNLVFEKEEQKFKLIENLKLNLNNYINLNCY